MSSIKKRPGAKMYTARWREYPGGPQKTRLFKKKEDGTNFLKTVDYQLLTGVYVPPEGGLISLREFSEEWWGRRTRAPSTEDRVARELKLHILPPFGHRPIGTIRKPDIEKWAKNLTLAPSNLAPSSAQMVYETLKSILACAVGDGRLSTNHADKAWLTPIDKVPFVPLTVDQVHAITDGMRDDMKAAVVVAAGTGLRQGELFGLTVDRVDFLRMTLNVDRQLFTPSKGRPFFKPPKGAPKCLNGYRTITLNGMLVEVLAAHLAQFGPGEDGIIFHNTVGRGVVRSDGGKYMREATKRAGVEATWHDLRHYHATELLSEGVNPALVAERLGHDLKTLLTTYAHVMPKDEDRVREILDRSLGKSAEVWLRSKAV